MGNFFFRKSLIIPKNLKEDRLNLQNALTKTNVFGKVPFDQTLFVEEKLQCAEKPQVFSSGFENSLISPTGLESNQRRHP